MYIKINDEFLVREGFGNENYEYNVATLLRSDKYQWDEVKVRELPSNLLTKLVSELKSAGLKEVPAQRVSNRSDLKRPAWSTVIDGWSLLVLKTKECQLSVPIILGFEFSI